VTKLPVPESLKTFKLMAKSEPVSMAGQPPIIWDRARGINVFDRYGNKWLDWSCGVLITNAGHSRKEICDAIIKKVQKPLLATYVFPHEDRAILTGMLQELAPRKTDKVFLLSTGSEAVENCIKLARTHGVKVGGPQKHIIVSFKNAFHGRTLGVQLAGGRDDLKRWIVLTKNTGFVQVPFPDGYKNPDTSFKLFEKTLKALKVNPRHVAGVVSESFQGVGPDFMPKQYAQALAAWCKKYNAVLIMDEVQAGFGRSGKMFTFEHYGIKPDLVACGKGISSSLALSAVIGRKDIMDLYPPGSMTSTHSASPLPVAAAIQNLKLIKKERLVQRAAHLGPILEKGLKQIQAKFPQIIGCVHCRGLVAGMQIVKPGTKEPDPVTAQKINEKCFQKGLLMFAPVGIGGECVKIAPALIIPKDALLDGLKVLDQACQEVLG
jgi:4-aminobutyrate aminotransferase / (S)-3-amino-2-methylpropionate transaminase / 5-aminovalerate transaminase